MPAGPDFRKSLILKGLWHVVNHETRAQKKPTCNEIDFISQNSTINLESLANIKCFPVFVSTELPTLKYQNTYLSGDALFAFPPSFAQGASQSIETANGILENITNSNSIYKDKISKILRTIIPQEEII